MRSINRGVFVAHVCLLEGSEHKAPTNVTHPVSEAVISLDLAVPTVLLPATRSVHLNKTPTRQRLFSYSPSLPFTSRNTTAIMAPKALKSNPTALGDPISLKAETSDTEPTDQDRPSKQTKKAPGEGKTLKQIAEEKLKSNPTALGDPVSLKAEKSDSHPTDRDLGAEGGAKSKL